MKNYRNLTLEFIERNYSSTKKYKMEFVEQMRRDVINEKLKICLFGSGFLGKGFYNDFLDMGIRISYFCDNDKNKWGEVVKEDVRCISPEELQKLYINQNILVVISLGKVEDVYEQLVGMGIKQIIKHPFDLLAANQNNWMHINCEEIMEKVSALFEILEDEKSKKVAYGLIRAMFMKNQELNEFSYCEIYSNDIYIPEKIIELKKGESIVDAGSFTGDTLKYFLNTLAYDEFENYYCFELNVNNVKKMKENLGDLKDDLKSKITIFNKAVSENTEDIYYTDSTSSSHLLEDTNGIKGEAVSLDSILLNDKVTYIKMDIEGSEISALKGAENILKEKKPICAISVYHKATDVWEIPLILKKYVPDYKIYLRHHEQIQAESLCYATTK